MDCQGMHKIFKIYFNKMFNPMIKSDLFQTLIKLTHNKMKLNFSV